MKRAGYLLITAGFLAASYFAVVRAVGVPVASYLVALGVGIVGVILVRLALHREASHEDVLAANLGAIDESLNEIVKRVGDLDARKDEIDVYDLRLLIDRDLPAHLDAFVLARHSIAHRFGLQQYADVMNPFSAGERYINRVWSASTDGYIDEAHDYLELSRQQFEEAQVVFRKLQG